MEVLYAMKEKETQNQYTNHSAWKHCLCFFNVTATNIFNDIEMAVNCMLSVKVYIAYIIDTMMFEVSCWKFVMIRAHPGRGQ